MAGGVGEGSIPLSIGYAALTGVGSLGVLFLMMLVGLFWGGSAPQPLATWLRVVAVATLPAMFWALSRIG